MKFEDYRIAPEIKKSLERLEFKRPTDIQFKAIPPILKGEDILGIAQTGTGKTAAFAIPILHLINERKKGTRKKGVKCVVMAPTHELAIQIADVFNQIGKNTRVRTMALYGGTEQDPQKEKLSDGVDIIVATPGRLFDLRSQGFIRLEEATLLVLDEADHMLDLGFYQDIKDLIGYLPKKRQTLFFSATINEKIKKLAYSLVKNPIRIQISPKDPISKNITHAVTFLEMDDKRFFLERAIQENEDRKMLVFVRTKVRAERVKAAMERVNIDTLTIHSDKDQKERSGVMQAFKSGVCKVLIATDISARGIDIPDVEVVINYDLPDVPENYVHRIGRTGRGREKGIAFSFCSPNEKEYLEAIEEYIGHEIDELIIDKSLYQQTMDLSNENESVTMKQIRKEIEEVAQLKKRKKRKSKKKK
ncbi:DEAD/DEAH box helicase [Jiulongibacter sp. NS-SX5]|uniref:DEAD/DEAH box helicase n=1 Tax=Jiulongibacter sp. NS-SX5 TaxID=3463854 RepID=UPI0040580539